VIDAWRELMRRDPDALACQSPEWLDALAASGWRDVSRLYDHGVLLPLARRRGIVASMPEAWGMGGTLADGPADLRPVVDDLRRMRALRVSVRPNPLHAAAWREATERVPHQAIPRRAHVLDLAGGPDSVWTDGFASSARRAVRKAEVDVSCAATPEALRDYRTLHERSVERWAAAQNEPLTLARARANHRDPPQKLARLAGALGEGFRLWMAYREGTPVAGIVVLLGPNASYTRGAMDKGRVNGANELLHWHAIQEACAAGCRSYQMGESGGSRNLARFKEKLGARPHDYAEYRFERLPLTRADAVVRGAIKRAVGFRDA
jgi:lipid II:glycine glycyltransferase (peptidoglycan interpeptide bridge formation enzyme)